jgi:hypothetical protein
VGQVKLTLNEERRNWQNERRYKVMVTFAFLKSASVVSNGEMEGKHLLHDHFHLSNDV